MMYVIVGWAVIWLAYKWTRIKDQSIGLNFEWLTNAPNQSDVDMDDIKLFLEPTNGPMGLVANPGAKSTDNPLLLSSIAFVLFPWLGSGWLSGIASERALSPGVYARHPWQNDANEKKPSAHDDHWGLAVALPNIAQKVLEHGRKHFWFFGDAKLNHWLGRIAGFSPTVELSATRDLSGWAEAKLCLAYLINCFESYGNTNGRQLLWLTSVDIPSWRYRPIALMLKLWKKRMTAMYPDGPREMFAVYYWQHYAHPFRVYGPRKW